MADSTAAVSRRNDPALSLPPIVAEPDLAAVLRAYLPADQIDTVSAACRYGAQAHAGQTRITGEPYIHHPLAVAKYLAEMGMDTPTIVAAILHDVVEDTPTAKEDLAERFGTEVAELVDGVTKLTQMKFRSRAEAQAENFRKMLLAMAQDIRVILIKLADRLHNMRTVGALPAPKRRRIARETLEIYLPIANRLGLEGIRRELDELCLAALYPIRFQVLRSAAQRAERSRQEWQQQVIELVRQHLAGVGIDAQVAIGPLSLAALYERMREQRRRGERLSFSDAHGLFGLRVVVSQVDECYRSLGILHNLYKPLPGHFQDHIAIPRANGYQSLHTRLFGPRGLPIEVRIRTQEMDRFAEAGIAAHWAYRGPGSSPQRAQDRVRDWLTSLLEMQQRAGNSVEFLEHVKVDLFPDEVYVFTPRGKILKLPRGATVLDFAYAVHTDLGNTCVAAKVDRRFAPLSAVLQSGQTVEVVTAGHARPRPNWLNFAVTAKARAHIRHFLKQLHREEACELGRRILEQALPPDALPEGCLERAVRWLGFARLDDLYVEIGLGQRPAPLVVQQILDARVRAGLATAGAAIDSGPEGEPDSPGEPGAGGEVRHGPGAAGTAPIAALRLDGRGGMVLSYARCCRPIPGDPAAGFLSSGKGVVVHRESCRNFVEAQRLHPEQRVEIDWGHPPFDPLPAAIRVDARNQPGVLASVAAAIAELGSNIENVALEDRDGLVTSMSFLISVRHLEQLETLLRQLRRHSAVVQTSRIENF